MKKNFLLVLMILTFLPACKQIGGTANTQSIAVADTLAKAFISAYEGKDIVKYQSLFDKDAILEDLGSLSARNAGAVYIRNISTMIGITFRSNEFEVKLPTYFVSVDGRYVSLMGTYTNKGMDGKIHTVPTAVILEIRDGKIIRETDYYDGTDFG